MTDSLSDIYTHHHAVNRERGFSILKDERGTLINELVGTGRHVLDIGCRDGALTSFFAKGNDVLGVDIDEVALEKARKLGIRTMKADLNGKWQELGSERFDVIVAGEVLEHLYNPGKVAEKARARLSPSGIFIGSVPNAFSLINRLRYLLGRKKGTPLADPTHINQFHAIELRDILRKHFAEVEVRGLGNHRFLARLSPNLFAFDLFFICRT